ncbi:DUF4391 domain-containing protein [Clostridium lacusfryxellense]|uniref:DUF4391 domain-containing protein n=1 Tax=Clostridium lacusfryxellense TaxID=205328 RepID=UPI001C0CA470|nr:DUF4391 domain-containing protein [Clostridium lacusfryxellense]MBU3114041.1 DUF4391 domain-containing protein [Clostridium lacusfryxellense]
MLDFPRSTAFNKKIPKQKFYEKLSVSSGLEQQFVKEIDTVYWKNKLSPETLNVSSGESVTEIEVFEIALKEQRISKNIIEAIDREISYHIVFVVKYKDLGQIWISFKEDSKSREGKFKVYSYYKTDWLKYDDLSLKIEGLNLDKIYETFMLQVADGKLQLDDGSDIKEAVTKGKELEKLESYINKLEVKVKNEKQYNRQVKFMGELRKAKTQLQNDLKKVEVSKWTS